MAVNKSKKESGFDPREALASACAIHGWTLAHYRPDVPDFRAEKQVNGVMMSISGRDSDELLRRIEGHEAHRAARKPDPSPEEAPAEDPELVVA